MQEFYIIKLYPKEDKRNIHYLETYPIITVGHYSGRANRFITEAAAERAVKQLEKMFPECIIKIIKRKIK